MTLTDSDFLTAGFLAAQNNQTPLADKLFRAALEVNPDNQDSLVNLGTLLNMGGDPAGALPHFARCIALNPSNARAWGMLGTVYNKLDKFPDARSCMARAIDLDPCNAAYHLNMAAQMEFIGDLDGAEKCYAQAIACNPGDVPARYQWGMIKMLRGNFSAGLPLYECRLDHNASGVWHPQNIWSNFGNYPEKVSDIGIVSEQGLGDLFQMVRYVKVLKELFPFARVHLQCGNPAIVPLMKRVIGFDNVASNTLLGCTFKIAAMSLPYLCVLAGKDIYQAPAMIDVNGWEDPWLRGGFGVKNIGLCWHGNPKHDRDRFRSMSFKLFKTCLPKSDQYFGCNLQFESDADPEIVESFQTGRSSKGWIETAAALNALDIIVTVDTAVAHLAGTLGKKVFLLLSKVGDWRWGLEGEESPWYPGVRLFRQKDFQDWEPVLHRVQQALQEEITG